VTDPTCIIDFLPAHYRERGRKRQSDLWRLLVAAMLGGIIVGSGLAVHRMRRQVEHEMISAECLGSGGTATVAKLTALQAELQPLRSQAELLTYLRHPWPRTQLLSAVLEPMPTTITLTRLHIVRETQDKTAPRQPPRPAGTPSPAGATANKDQMIPSDLDRLRAEGDSLQWIVFSRVELGPVEGADNDQARFTARLTVRPGYGQQGGPAIVPTTRASTKVASSIQAGAQP
jgi:hypothetical protein